MSRRRATWSSIVVAAQLAVLAACGTGGSGAATAVVSGTVTRGPMCPVVQDDEPCPDEPADVVLVFVRDGDEVADVRTGADGTYEVSLAPGRYDVRIEGEQAGIGGVAEPATVTVAPGAGMTQDFSVDTGIR